MQVTAAVVLIILVSDDDDQISNDVVNIYKYT